MVKEDLNNFKDIVKPFVSYFKSLVDHDDYLILYRKWALCNLNLDTLIDVIGDTNQEIKVQTPLKVLLDYYRFFEIKNKLFLTDLSISELQTNWIKLLEYRNICIKNTILMNLYYHDSLDL
jgi:hypothetical protein